MGKILGRLNKPSIPDYKYRSPEQTNAEDLTPNFREDVAKSTDADLKKVKKGFTSKESLGQTESRRNSPHGNLSQKDAAGRAISRLGGRGGALGVAQIVGEAIGRKLDEKYPELGKNIVEKSGAGSAIDKIVNMRDKVELSESSKKRLKEDGDDSDKPTMESLIGSKMKAGGKVKSASARADGCAIRGKTRA
jgi:hypothetical protein